MDVHIQNPSQPFLGHLHQRAQLEHTRVVDDGAEPVGVLATSRAAAAQLAESVTSQVMRVSSVDGRRSRGGQRVATQSADDAAVSV